MARPLTNLFPVGPQTRLDPDFFNGLIRELQSRISELQVLKQGLEAAIGAAQEIALDRVNEIIGPAQDDLNARLAEAQAALDSAQALLADLSDDTLFATNNLSDLDNAATARENLGLGTAATSDTGDFATAVQGAKADSAVQPDTANQLTAAYTAGVDDDGTQSSGTYTPSLAAGSQYKKIINGGAFTLAPPSLANDEATTLNVFITNSASAGAITTSGFTKVSGDDFTTTNGDDFICAITIFDIGGTEYSLLDVRAMQ